MNTHYKHTLANGLELLLIPLPQVKSVTVLIMIGAGSRHETKNINGLSHFMEHMAFKGSKKRPSALAISSEIDAIGGEFNAFTGKDHTGFYIKAAVKHLPLLVDVLSDMLLHPLLQKEEIEREKGVITEEINMYHDTPMRYVGTLFERLVYGDHPLGWDTAGEVETIRKLQRSDFIKYIDDLYRPNNTIVAVAGGVGGPSASLRTNFQTKIIKLIENSLSDWKKKRTWQYKQASDKQARPAVKIKYKKTEQAHLCLGVHAYPLGHPQKEAMSVLNSVLGGGMSSRLFIEVRERRGLAYYVKTDLSKYKDVGNFVVQAGVDVNRIDEAIKVIQDQLFGIASGQYQISDKELQKAKEHMKGRLTLELEDSRAVAGFYGAQQLLKRKFETPSAMMKKVDSVKVEQVLEVAKDIFVQKRLNLAIIGPFKEEGRFRGLLGDK